MKKTVLLSLLVMCSFLFGQKMKVESGNYDFLKGVTDLKVTFDFSHAKFYNENMDENQYISKRFSDIEKDKGKEEAEKWKKDWEYSKNTSFVDKFLTSFNKSIDIKASTDSNSQYTLNVKTIWIYPGWFGGVMSQPAKVSTILTFTETNNPSTVLLQISSEKAPGDGNFIGVANNNDRISEGYAKTAKSLVRKISSRIR